MLTIAKAVATVAVRAREELSTSDMNSNGHYDKGRQQQHGKR